MNELQEYLHQRGFSERRAQTALFEHLIKSDRTGVIAQAGTGTGKSAAILSAAANKVRETGEQSIVVTPTLTLMNQYRDGDTPYASMAFDDLTFSEVRGMSHYRCEQSIRVQAMLDVEHERGCLGFDAGCTQKLWEGHDDGCMDGCEMVHQKGWECGYREARYMAGRSDVVVTNADMLIVNDRTLYALGKEFLSLDGSLFVDEAHTLEQKLRDYASRSLFHGTVKNFDFAGTAGPELARWLKAQDRNLALKDTRGFPEHTIERIATAVMPEQRPGDGLSRQRDTQEACARILSYLRDPHEHAVVHVNDGSLKYDWINIAQSAGTLLTTRDFGLVSATVPRTMGSVLGVPEAPFIDVGHPFDYGKQAWLGFSDYAGDYRSAQSDNNFNQRVAELKDLLQRSKGGALILFSSFRDLERVWERLEYDLQTEGITVLKQERDLDATDRQAMADTFKADGNAVLFGSESFATGFDVPGNALRLVVVWKLPYPAVDPVSNAIRSNSYARYEDIMKVRAIQAIGRLVRTDEDRGIVWVADSRGRKLVDSSDPLTSHLPQFARL